MDHHFRVIQLPFNLLEPRAALERNQPDDQTVLEVAREKRLGVLINRPAQCFYRQTDGTPGQYRRTGPDGLQGNYRLHQRLWLQSETRLWRKILPGMASIPVGLRIRIKQQGCFAETLKHHWRTFGSFERWREAKDGIFLPRIQGVLDFLVPHAAETIPTLQPGWQSHEKILERALRAVASIYADDAVAQEKEAPQHDRPWPMIAWARPGHVKSEAPFAH
jgi:hypothetical protein